MSGRSRGNKFRYPLKKNNATNYMENLRGGRDSEFLVLFRVWSVRVRENLHVVVNHVTGM